MARGVCGVDMAVEEQKIMRLASISLCVLLGGCAAAPKVPEPPVRVSLQGAGQLMSVHLELYRSLDGIPREGWLNTVEVGDADGKMGARRAVGVRYELKDAYVAFQINKKDDRPGARYRFEGETLVLCVLNTTLRSEGVNIAFHFDYDTCLPMIEKGATGSGKK
jgi:hypothetical protein